MILVNLYFLINSFFNKNIQIILEFKNNEFEDLMNSIKLTTKEHIKMY